MSIRAFLLHAEASRPDNPAAPLVLRAALRIVSPFKFSKRFRFVCSKVFGEADFPGGCFSINTSHTVHVAYVAMVVGNGIHMHYSRETRGTSWLVSWWEDEACSTTQPLKRYPLTCTCM